MGAPRELRGKECACQCRRCKSSIPGSERSPREEHGKPLQYSCLENPTDGGAWWATVHGVAKSRTRLSDFTSLHFGLKILLLKSHYGSGSLFCGNRTFKLALPENADGPKAYVLQMPLGFSQAVPWAGSGQEVFSALFQTALVPLNSS